MKDGLVFGQLFSALYKKLNLEKLSMQKNAMVKTYDINHYL